MFLYGVRRKLQFTREEWESLPWPDQRMYIEGLQAEFPPTDEDGNPISGPANNGPATEGGDDDAIAALTLGTKSR